MADEPAKRPARQSSELPPNARVSMALTALAVAFYVAIVLNHLPP